MLGGEPVALRGGRGPRILLLTHAPDCAACNRYLRGITRHAAEFSEWDGRLLVVVPGSAGESGALAGDNLPGARVLADPEQRLTRQLGLGGAAVVIADEWGEIYFAVDAGVEHELPAPVEILEWVRFVSIQCPECEQPEGEWRTLE
jgi:peroxiredoxin